MKFLKLILRNGNVIIEYKRGLYSNDFYYPLNYQHVYNMMCCLLDKTPTPQNRTVNSKYMPFHSDVMECVLRGYIKIECVSKSENITTIKTAYNANVKNDSVKQYTWFDCELTMKDSFVIFKQWLKEFGVDYSVAYNKGFADTMCEIINHERIDELKEWFRKSKNTVLANYIENHKDYKGDKSKSVEVQSKDFNKRVFRGCTTSNTYEAIMYIPLTDKLKAEYDNYSIGWTSMLDGGLVEYQDYTEVSELDIIDFTPIKNLSKKRKSQSFKKDKLDFKNNVYNNIKNNVTRTGVNELIVSLGLVADTETLFSKNVSLANLNNFMQKLVNDKYSSENVLDLDYVKNILNDLSFEWADEYETHFIEKKKLVIKEYKIVSLIEKIIAGKLYTKI